MRVKGQLYPHKYDTIISQDLFNDAEAVRNGYKVKKLSTSPFNEHLVSFLEPGGVSRWAHS